MKHKQTKTGSKMLPPHFSHTLCGQLATRCVTNHKNFDIMETV